MKFKMSISSEPLLNAVVLLCVLQISLYFIITRRKRTRTNFNSCLSTDSITRSPLDNHEISIVELRFANIKKLIRLYTITNLVITFFIFIKYVLCITMDLSSWSEYRFIDCYILGRLVLGTQAKVSKYSALLVTCCLSIIRWYINISRPKLKFYVLEFILYEYEEVLVQELKFKNSNKPKKEAKSKRRYLNINGLHNIGGQELTQHSLFWIKRYLPKDGERVEDSRENILRLNRSTKCWQLFRSLTFYYYFYVFASFVLVMLFISYFIVPSILRESDSKNNYYRCTEWRDRCLNDSTFEPARCKFVNDILDNRYYNFLRIIADLIENFFIYSDIFGWASSTLFLYLLIIPDIYINALKIKSRLKHLLGSLRQTRVFNHQCYNDTIIKTTDVVRRHWPKSNGCETSDIIELQDILVDHLHMTIRYNSFMTFIAIMLMIALAGYSAIIIRWATIVGRSSIKIELYIILVFYTSLLFFLLGLMAFIRTKNAHLYKLITSAMALDDSLNVTKHRWTMILKYYFPRPLYAYRMLGVVDVSWLLMIKVCNCYDGCRKLAIFCSTA